MRLTKLKIVQDVLSKLDLDNATSVAELPESEQIGYIVDSIYDDMNGDFPWPHLREFSTLEVTAVANEMRIPEGIMTLEDVWYNKKLLSYVSPKKMITLLQERDTTEAAVDDNGAKNDADPQFWTSYDDTVVVFDSYDGTLASALSLADMYRMPIQMTADTDYPDLPERFHQTLLNGVTADSFSTLKGDTTNFNIFRNRYNKGMIKMDRWAQRVNRKTKPGDKINYAKRSN